jgi:hypothetical protein
MNPYCGPRPFTRDDGDRFFGRERETSDLFSLLVAHRAVLLYAQSGAGKTSLLNAKLIPKLEGAGFDVLPRARVTGAAVPAPGRDPTNAYAFNCICYWQPEPPPPGLTLADALRARPVRRDDAGEPRPRVIIVDQFEELFTSYPERWPERRVFFAQLAEAMQAERTLRVLFAMREDFLAHVDAYEDLVEEELRTRFRLTKLNRECGLLAIRRPLEGTGIHFQPAAPGVRDAAEVLIDNLLRAPAGGAPHPPAAHDALAEHVEAVQLQVVCFKLFQALPAGTGEITAADVASLADVDRALGAFYNGALREAAKEAKVDEDRLRGWFDTQAITSSGTRGLILRGPEETGGLPNAAIDHLDALHIIRPEIRGADRWYELSHDRFIQPIRRANDAWRERAQQAEQAALEKARRKEIVRQWLGRFTVVVGVLCVAIAVLAVFAFRQRNEARKSAEQAREARDEELQANARLKAANAELNSRINVLQSQASPRVGVPDDGSAGKPYTAPTLARLYNFPTEVDGRKLDGQGQTVAVIELGGGYRKDDLDQYFRALHLESPSVTSVSVDGAKNQPDRDNAQASLDVEIVGAVAPKARIVFYFAPNTSRTFLHAIEQVVHDATDPGPGKSRPSVLLLNWGGVEATWTSVEMDTFNDAFRKAGAAGITVISSSGDRGPTEGFDDGHSHVSFPASSPYVLACGGTALTAAGDRIVREDAWGNKSGTGSGGGISNHFPRPPWQPRELGSTGPQTGRALPDVAAHAALERGYVLRFAGKSEVTGGTTAAAALWAGLIALINQALGHNVGFINQRLYAEGIGASAAFNPVGPVAPGDPPRTGNARWSSGTGWGSPNGKALLEALRRPSPTSGK